MPRRSSNLPNPDHLEVWRLDLRQHGFTLTQGERGLWYAASVDGLEIYPDRDPQRAYCLAIAAIFTRQFGAEDEMTREAVKAANARHKGGK